MLEKFDNPSVDYTAVKFLKQKFRSENCHGWRLLLSMIHSFLPSRRDDTCQWEGRGNRSLPPITINYRKH
uniref:Bm472 n=1 Tax=Brugia malayi TaxID=6279 RepID=A0A1I9G2I8_BRUMA|nr:Bm472 [Brugia malayi]